MSDTRAKKAMRRVLRTIGYLSVPIILLGFLIYTGITFPEARLGYLIALGIIVLLAGFISLYHWAWNK